MQTTDLLCKSIGVILLLSPIGNITLQTQGLGETSPHYNSEINEGHNLLAVPIQVAIGYNFTCAINSAGGAMCWGYNGSKQLGDGTSIDKFTPTQVIGLTSNVKFISASQSHACALMNTGSVKCWGSNGDGQLGDGTGIDSGTPVDVIDLPNNVSILTTGYNFTCAGTDSILKCWGVNDFGQLGDGTTKKRLSPILTLNEPISTVSAGENFVCVLTTSGITKCWGANNAGQLGNGTTVSQSTPSIVSGLTGGVTAIKAGRFHACALSNSGNLKCWGDNANGQLGDGTKIAKTTPTDVIGLNSAIKTMSLGESHTCAITTQGGTTCWGANGSGQLGDGTTTSSSAPVASVGILTSNVSDIGVGHTHTCGMLNNTSLKCWGNNGSGRLGNGTTTNSITPVDVIGLSASSTTATATPIPPQPTATNTSVPSSPPSLSTSTATLPPSASATTIPNSNQVDWLYMLYLAGDNTLNPDVKKALKSLEEQMLLPSFSDRKNKLKIVIWFDGSDNNDSEQWILVPGQSPEKQPKDELNMADPKTLKEFVVWAKKNHPANHYYLAIGDHGSATVGIAQDLQGKQNNSDRNYMTIKDLRSVLLEVTDNGNNKIDILHLDACLMALFEVSYDLKDTAHYLIASQNPTWTIFSYAAYAALIPPQENISAQNLAIEIAKKYASILESIYSDRVYTISTFDLKKVQLVSDKLDQFAKELKKLVEFKTEDKYPYRLSIQQVQASAQHFDSRESISNNGCPLLGTINENDDFLDLYDIAVKAEQEANLPDETKTSAKNLKEELNKKNFVIYNQFKNGKSIQNINQDVSSSHGISIYFPRNKNVTQNDFTNYIDNKLFEFTKHNTWPNFLYGLYDYPNVGLPEQTCVAQGEAPVNTISEITHKLYISLIGNIIPSPIPSKLDVK